MHIQRLRSLLRRQNAASFTLLFLLLVVAVTAVMVQSSASAGGGGGQRPPFPSDEDLKKDFDDDDVKAKDDKPGGKWGYGTLLDSKKDDPSVPAYVSSIELLSGGGKYQGINKIKRVEVTNKTSRAIASVQVRVEVVNLDEPEKVLLEDEFPFANASIDPNSSRVVEIKTLHPPKLLKALAKNGELYGRFGIRMGVQAVRFADGSFWRRPEPAALLKSPYLDLSIGLRFPDWMGVEVTRPKKKARPSQPA
jgi:hypothetical protein